MNRFNFLKKHIKEGLILDVGNLGFDGKMHKKILENFPNSFLTGFDNNKEKAEKLNFPNQVIGDINKPLPFEDNYFDTVYLGEIIEHTWEPEKFLTEVYRVLKKNGVVVIDTPNVYALNRILKIIFCRDYAEDSDHKIIFAPAVLKRLLQKCNFKIVELITDRKFNISSKTFTLLNIPPFRNLGGHLCIAAEK